MSACESAHPFRSLSLIDAPVHVMYPQQHLLTYPQQPHHAPTAASCTHSRMHPQPHLLLVAHTCACVCTCAHTWLTLCGRRIRPLRARAHPHDSSRTLCTTHVCRATLLQSSRKLEAHGLATVHDLGAMMGTDRYANMTPAAVELVKGSGSRQQAAGSRCEGSRPPTVILSRCIQSGAPNPRL